MAFIKANCHVIIGASVGGCCYCDRLARFWTTEGVFSKSVSGPAKNNLTIALLGSVDSKPDLRLLNVIKNDFVLYKIQRNKRMLNFIFIVGGR